MRYKEQEFGGKLRIFLTPEEMNEIAEINKNRLTEDQLDVIQIIREGFHTLSEMQQRVIMLMVDQNMSERKVAITLGLHYGTVLRHLDRARKKLKLHVMQNLDSSIISETLCEEKKPNEADKEDTSTSTDTDEND